MGRAPLPHLLALLCGFLAAVAVGCGGDRSHLIPSDRASSLTQQLNAIKASIDAGDCSGLATRVDQFHDDATSLTKPIDSRLRKRLNDGVSALQDHAVPDCEAVAKAKTTATQTTTTPTDTTPTETVQTNTTPTETVPTDTTPTTPPTDTTTTTTPPTDTTTTPPADTTTTPPPPSANGGTPGQGELP